MVAETKAEKIEENLANSNGTCFVIMPFSQSTDKHTEQYWTKHYETFLKPLIEEATKLEVKRSEALRGNLLSQIVLDLTNSVVVVADLTDRNPNVFWELGVRQSFRHGTITIAEKGTALPFDVGHNSTLFYNPSDHLEMQTFIRTFNKALKDCLTNTKETDSSVLEILGGRGSLIQLVNKDENIRKLDALLVECDHNISVLNRCIVLAKKNQEQRKSSSDKEYNPGINFPTNRHHTAAIELLITQRYLEKDQRFYNKMEIYYNNVATFRAQEDVWEMRQDSTEKWIIKAGEGRQLIYTTFKESIEKVKSELATKVI